MKKILFILLCTVSMYGQVSTGQEQEFDYGIKNNASAEIATPPFLVSQGIDGTYGKMNRDNVIEYLEFASAVNLPATGAAGKIYVTKDNNKIYRWNGTYYTELAITDISGKVDKVTGKSLLSDTEITRLATLSNYTHPANHPPSIITQDASNRFVTDAEKTTWNGKQNALGFTPENVANKSDSYTVSSTTTYPNTKALVDGLATKSTNIPQLESNATDLTVWNNGKGNSATNTSFGELALRSNTVTSNSFNSAFGYSSLSSNTSGTNNTAIGYNALNSNVAGTSNVAVGSFALSTSNTSSNVAIGNSSLNKTTGSSNSAIGNLSLFENTTGSSNSAVGDSAGRYISDGITANAITNNSIFLGNKTKALANNQTNQIVIGDNATGAGSNTVTLGNASITKTVLRGAVETNGSFINSTAPATNVLLAGGTTLSQNTAFNKNFGTTAGTVAQGNDSRILNGQTAFGWGNHANAGYALSNGSNLQSYTPSDWVSKSIPQVINASHSFTNGNLELSGHLYRSDGNYGNEHYDHYFGKGTAIAGSVNSFANLRVRVTDGGVKALRFGGDGSFSWDEANVLHALNFNSYSPTLTGTGATGTWGINISGNAASATNWGGRPADLNAIQTDFDLVLTRGASDAVTRLTPLPQFRTWLGLGSNAYSSTAFLPLSGGTVTGNFKLNGLLLSDNFTGGNPQVLNPTATVLYLGNTGLTNINYEAGTRHEFYIGGSVKGRFNSTGLFVDGTVTASPATLPNHAVVKSQLDAVKPYKVYSALIKQTAANAPIITVLENNLGGTIVWTRSETGVYIGTLTGAFPLGKTFVSCSSQYFGYTVMLRLDADTVSILTRSPSNTPTDGFLEHNAVEIRVYL